MSNEILNLLKQIEQVVLESRLNNALSEETLNGILNAHSVTNPELKELYKWKNGSKFSYEDQSNVFCRWGYIIPMEMATETYLGNEFASFKQNGFFPFLSDFAGLVLLLRKDEPNRPVFIYCPGLLIVKPEPIFENLSTFLLSIIECYSTKVYIIHENILEMDMDAEDAVYFKNSQVFKIWAENK